MNENELIGRLQREGFSRTYVSDDVANARYPDHTHRMETAHIVMSGEMTLTIAGKSTTYRAGERCDVPAETVHSAIMGPRGCRYVIGERES
jgi:mannose-6-phosphate isomerase-like protein (cupin superfamily)